MNKIDSFNNLSFDEKVKCIWMKATFLMSKNSATHRINLYSHDNYFIQLNYNFIDCKIEKIEATELNVAQNIDAKKRPQIPEYFLKLLAIKYANNSL